jgi:hypothetical protein
VPEKYSTTNDYTDAELLALYRECLARISVSGQSYQVMGRIFTAANLAEVRRQIEWLEGRINSASGMATNIARIKRPQ